MKVEDEGTPLILQEGQPPGKMAHNEKITAVLLQDGWHEIEPGSFRMLRTHDRQVPFIEFRMNVIFNPAVVQVFPNSLYGVAVRVVTDE